MAFEKRPTITDVARAAGVSITTVSKAVSYTHLDEYKRQALYHQQKGRKQMNVKICPLLSESGNNPFPCVKEQ